MKISVITTTYNAERYIQETINSVLFQSFIDFEYIIIDDCSYDNTITIIESYVDGRIKLYKNEKNLGIVGSRNRGLELAQGDYICFLDHDDIRCNQDKLSKQFNYMETHVDVGIVGSYCICFEGDRNIERLRFEIIDQEIRSKILITNQFSTCSVMIRRNVLDQVGYMDSQYEKVDDYDLRLRVGVVSKFANIPEFLVKYRYHSMNTTKQENNLRKMRYITIDLIKKNKKKYPNSRIGILIQFILLHISVYQFEKIRKFIFKQ